MSTLSEREIRLMAFLQRRSIERVASGEVAQWLRIPPVDERKLLSRLARKGMLQRLRRGLYLVPDQLPAGGRWNPGEARVVTELMSDCGGRYQVSGPNAFVRYGWETQVPTEVCVYNNRLSGQRTIGSTRLRLIRVEPQRLGGTELIRMPGGDTLVFAGTARALLDAVYDWSRFNSLPKGFDWIRREIEADADLAAKLVAMCVKYGNQAARRRIGYILDNVGVSERLLQRIERTLHSTTSYIPLVPGQPKRGGTDKRWMIADNEGKSGKGFKRSKHRDG